MLTRLAVIVAVLVMGLYSSAQAATIYVPALSTATPSMPSGPGPGPRLEVQENWSSYRDSLGYLHVVGEYANTGSANALYTQAIARLLDHQGNFLAEERSYTPERLIQPGKKACFDIVFRNPPPDSVIGSVSFDHENLVGGTLAPGLVIFNATGGYAPDFSHFRLDGQVRNDSAGEARDVFVTATLYSGPSGSGRAVRCGGAFVDTRHIPASGVANYTLRFFGLVPGTFMSSVERAEALQPE